MKKSIIASLIAIVFLSACKETETTTVDISGTGTIQVTVLGDTEKVNTPDESEPVEGVQVRVLWDSEDLAIVSDGDNIRRSSTATTDANGQISIEVPTIDDGVSFDIEIDEFQRDISFNDGTADVTQNVTFSSSSRSVTVRSGETIIEEFDLEDNFKNASDDLDEFATITGVVMADLEQVTTLGVSEPAEGVTVTVTYNNWEGTTTTDASGVYSIQAPVGVAGYTVTFEEYTADVTYNNGIANVTVSATFDDTNSFFSGLDVGDTREIDHDYTNDFATGFELPELAVLTGVAEANSERINTPDLIEPAVGATVTIQWTDDTNFNTVEVIATTDASGVYRVELPYNQISNRRVNVIFEEFTTGVDYNDGFRDVTGFSATYNDQTYNNVNLSLGSDTERDHNFSSNFVDELPTFARIDGTFLVRTNAIAGSETNSAVSGGSIRISWFDDDGIRRGTFVTTNASGEYSVEVDLSQTPSDQFFVQFPEVVITNYQFTNATPEDVTGTATYNEFETSFFLSAGAENTVDRTDETPDNVEEN